MEKIKLLIVDDVEDNRLVLRAICRKLSEFEIYEAVDGHDAVEQCDALRPHIILMDVMMPRLDGFQASKIIKERYPKTIIMAVTAVIDPKMEENMAAIGVAAYIRKPIDKELIRLKLQSYAGVISLGGKERVTHSTSVALNPFGEEVRSFKTIFEIHNMDAIMDFGMWLLMRFECARTRMCNNIDRVIELLYELLRHEVKSGAMVTITIEESFDDMFIQAPLQKPIKHNEMIDHLIRGLGDGCLMTKKMAAFRIPLVSSIVNDSHVQHKKEEPIVTIACAPKVNRALGSAEHQVLRESFIHKVMAWDYVQTLDADAYGEIHDLYEAQREWTSWEKTLSQEGSEENFYNFANEVLGAYTSAISALYEFSGLSYAIVSLSTLLKTHGYILANDEIKRTNVLIFLEGLKNDLTAWIHHIFEMQDALDIHYLDASFFSSCMQIESIITGTEVDLGDEVDIEFF